MSFHISSEDFTALLDGALSKQTRDQLEAHLTICQQCHREYSSLRQMKSLLSSAPRKAMPADLALALERKHVGHLRIWPVKWTTIPLLPMGAMAAFILVLGYWVHNNTNNEIPLEPLLTAHARYSAEVLVPEENLVAANYSDQLTANFDNADSELQ